MVKVYSNKLNVLVSSGGGYPSCPEWYIKNLEGICMGLEPSKIVNPYIGYGEVDVYHNGVYYTTTTAYVDTITNLWYVALNISGQEQWFLVMPGQCIPGRNSNCKFYVNIFVASGIGTASPASAIITSSQSATFTANPWQGYHFIKWEVVVNGHSYTSTVNPLTITYNDLLTIQPCFGSNAYNVTLKVYFG
ncbi:MAG: hypothetical protein RXO36_07410 [Candidatus Nanopusillus acidilobi]|jgi:hypothetical protein